MQRSKVTNLISKFYHKSEDDQSEDDFENFCNNFELTLDAVSATNPFLIVAIGDFSTKSSNWYTDGTNTFEDSKIEAITSQFGLQQIINEPTHIQGKSVSCIDLILSFQPNLVMGSGIHSSLHQNCHHQIICAKFNLKVHYSPPYERVRYGILKKRIQIISRGSSMDFLGKGLSPI